MAGKRSSGGFTLIELVAVIAILAILAGISCLFFIRNLDRPKASLNASNLKAARTRLKAELETDPDHPDAVRDRVLSGAPDAVGMDTPEIQLPNGTPMTAIIGDDGTVDTFYDGYNAEDFLDFLEGDDGEEETEPTTQPPYCAIVSCYSVDLMDDGYCADHQMKTCGKSLREGETLVPCGGEYRTVCDGAHYKRIDCPCTLAGSKNSPCRNCGHWHDRNVCGEDALVPDNGV